MIVSDSLSVGAGATSANVLLGLPEALLMEPTEISLRVSVNGAALGNDVKAKFFSGTSPKCGINGANTNPAVAAGKIDPQTDTILSRAAVIGQQSLYFTNTTAGALVVNWEVELHEF